MRLKAGSILVLIIALFCSTLVVSAQGFPAVSAIAVVMYDADLDLVVYGKNAYQRRSIASLTKIMTILYVSELVQNGKISLADTVTCSANAASRGGTEIKLRSGDQFTVEELLYASALASANDAAVALAEYVAGSEKEFARLMTMRAGELGLNETSFVDSTGLLSIYSGNYSTAYDLAILSQFAMENQLFAELVSTKEYKLKPQDKTIRNSNVLLHDIAGVNGIKTGATTPAGHTLITSVVRDGRHLIIVVLGAPSREKRNEQSEELLEYAYSSLRVVVSRDEQLAAVNIPDGVTHLVNAVLETDLSLFVMEPDDAKIETKVELLPKHAPVEQGEKIGELVILRAGEEITRVNLVSDQSTGLASFIRRIWNNIVAFFGNLF